MIFTGEIVAQPTAFINYAQPSVIIKHNNPLHIVCYRPVSLFCLLICISLMDIIAFLVYKWPCDLLTHIKYHFVKIQDMDKILCRTVFLKSFNVLVCVDSINFLIVYVISCVEYLFNHPWLHFNKYYLILQLIRPSHMVLCFFSHFDCLYNLACLLQFLINLLKLKENIILQTVSANTLHSRTLRSRPNLW